MRYLTGLLVAAGASTLLTGCIATQSQLKHVSDQQTYALNTERAERVASDSALAQQLGMVRGDVQALRADLENMRTEYGAKITALEDGLHFAMPVNFAFDDASVRDQDRAQLDRFAHVVNTYYPGSKVTVEGFADPAGSNRYNLELSARRANNVRQYLLSDGLTGNPIETVGYGETRLVTPGAARNDPGAELNRRVVFVIESRGQATVAMNNPEQP
jgi:outer membrane protein OmpA-like peptidoglycan-associated protein